MFEENLQFAPANNGRADHGGGFFHAQGGGAMRFIIDRHDLPYDAFVADPSWLCPINEEEGDERDAHAQAEEVQTDEVHGEGQPL